MIVADEKGRLLALTTDTVKALAHQNLTLENLAAQGKLFVLEQAAGTWQPRSFDLETDVVDKSCVIVGGGKIDALERPAERDSNGCYCVYENEIAALLDQQFTQELFTRAF